MPRNWRRARPAEGVDGEVLSSDLPAATVTAYPDGPLVLRGDFSVRDVDGAELCTGGLIALCRCGRSARKPLCDGTHRLPIAARDGRS
jgi:hypothetical protein